MASDVEHSNDNGESNDNDESYYNDDESYDNDDEPYDNGESFDNPQSIFERVNLTREFTPEELDKQDEEIKIVKENVLQLMDIVRNMNDMLRDIEKESTYNANANVLVSIIQHKNSNLLARNRKPIPVLQPELDSYRKKILTYHSEMLKKVHDLNDRVLKLMTKFKNPLHYKRLYILYDIVRLEFEIVFDIIFKAFQMSTHICKKTNDVTTHDNWLEIYPLYYNSMITVRTIYSAICKKFEKLFDALKTKSMKHLDDILQKYNEMLTTAKTVYDHFDTNEHKSKFTRNQSNQPNHNGGKAYKQGKRMTKRRKRHGRTHKNRA